MTMVGDRGPDPAGASSTWCSTPSTPVADAARGPAHASLVRPPTTPERRRHQRCATSVTASPPSDLPQALRLVLQHQAQRHGAGPVDRAHASSKPTAADLRPRTARATARCSASTCPRRTRRTSPRQSPERGMSAAPADPRRRRRRVAAHRAAAAARWRRAIEARGLRARRATSCCIRRPTAPGCLLLDLRMPGPSGLDLQEALQRQGVAPAGDLPHRPRRRAHQRAGDEGRRRGLPDQAGRARRPCSTRSRARSSATRPGARPRRRGGTAARPLRLAHAARTRGLRAASSPASSTSRSPMS
ncbi:MAG: hypothetical protein MZW92_10805 [Comamonadaceae bacterium]|nr:hypothetical protein [Comamonadaceae bacterium]